ncbi:MAG: DMT family transporter [Flavobacteriales bacterium]|nr:DMT family transporter [Flavobacteriales bacterium]
MTILEVPVRKKNKYKLSFVKTNFAKGVLFCLLSFFCFALMGALVKQAAPNASTPQILFFQNSIGLIIVLPFVLLNKGLTLKTEHIYMHLFRSLIGAAGMYFLFCSISLISLTNAILLTYTASLWIPLIVWLLFHQKVQKIAWIGIFTGFIGIILILNPNAKMVHFGSLIAILSGICLAFVLLVIRRLNATEPMMRIVFYSFLFSSIIFLPFAICAWRELTLQTVMYFLGISCALIFSQIFIAIAYRYASAVELAPFVYSSVVFAALINWLTWTQLPTYLEIFGILFVVIGGIVTTWKPKEVLIREPLNLKSTRN